VNEKRRIWLPVLFLVVLALTRIPGLLPPSFSGIYALAFCAGVFLPRKLAWALPVAFLFITDLLLNTLVYKVGAFNSYQWLTLLGFVSVIGLGRVFRPSDSWLKLLGGGILGAILFYLLTNSAAWFFNPYHNPEYTRDLTGWMVALTKGTSGFPPTWEFFRNTLLSGGLFTGFFVGAMKLNEAPEPETEEEAEEIPETEPEEGKA
jgi:hypothetical protein